MSNTLPPKAIKQLTSSILSVLWNDGHEGPIRMVSLRDSCPCAGCKGETVLFHTFVPPPAQVDTPGRYELRKAEPVGNYGVKFTWGDSHNMGMYTWEHLRSLCECDTCRMQHAQ